MALTAAIQHLVFDTHDPRLVAGFWAFALGRTITDDWGDFVRLEPDATGTRIAFAVVPEAKTVKNRLHLDLTTPDREQAVTEFVGHGASIIETRTQGEHSWTVMADPEGNEFCVA